MPDHDTTAHRLSQDCRSLLDELDHLKGIELTHVAFDLQTTHDERLQLSVQREEVVTGTPEEALTGMLIPWNADTEGWDYFHPSASFTSLGQLQMWLLDHYAS